MSRRGTGARRVMVRERMVVDTTHIREPRGNNSAVGKRGMLDVVTSEENTHVHNQKLTIKVGSLVCHNAEATTQRGFL